MKDAVRHDTVRIIDPAQTAGFFIGCNLGRRRPTMIDIILKLCIAWFVFVLAVLAISWIKDIIIDRPHRHDH